MGIDNRRIKMENIKTFQEALDKYGITYTIGIPEKAEATLKMLDNLMNEFFFDGALREDEWENERIEE